MASGVGITIAIVLMSLVLLSTSGGIIYLSVLQMENKDFSIEDNYVLPGGGCIANQKFDEHRPIRFEVENVTETFQCGWPFKNTAIRFLGHGSCILIILLLLFFSFLYPSPWGTRIILMMGMISAAGLGVSVFFDLQQILNTQRWCEENLEGAGFSADTQITCTNFNFVLVVLLQALAGLLWIILFLVSCSNVKYVKKMAKRRKQARLDEDHVRLLEELSAM